MRATILATLLVAAGCATSPPPAPEALPAALAAATLPTVGGADVSLAPLRGKVSVIDFFASWCDGCAEAMPHHQALAARGVSVVGVSLDEDEAALAAFLARTGPPTFPIARDPGGKLAEQARIDELPTVLVLGRDGALHARIRGNDPEAVAAAVARAEAAK